MIQSRSTSNGFYRAVSPQRCKRLTGQVKFKGPLIGRYTKISDPYTKIGKAIVQTRRVFLCATNTFVIRRRALQSAVKFSANRWHKLSAMIPSQERNEFASTGQLFCRRDLA